MKLSYDYNNAAAQAAFKPVVNVLDPSANSTTSISTIGEPWKFCATVWS
ncbi:MULTISPECIES: hypothetical protein [unclassified Leisingera]|nr:MULTISPECIES: hypothetical protein [unclassified Leisingera]MCF6432310.1 hypothetical protein [Leisingera sp. MMG026]